MNLSNRTLIRGDNLQTMQELPDTCIDLIATDPPFNSKRDYFIPFRDQHGQEPDSLVKAFSDTWEWGQEADAAYSKLLLNGNKQIGDTIEGLHKFLDETPMMAYLYIDFDPNNTSGSHPHIRDFSQDAFSSEFSNAHDSSETEQSGLQTSQIPVYFGEDEGTPQRTPILPAKMPCHRHSYPSRRNPTIK